MYGTAVQARRRAESCLQAPATHQLDGAGAADDRHERRGAPQAQQSCQHGAILCRAAFEHSRRLHNLQAAAAQRQSRGSAAMAQLGKRKRQGPVPGRDAAGLHIPGARAQGLTADTLKRRADAFDWTHSPAPPPAPHLFVLLHQLLHYCGGDGYRDAPFLQHRHAAVAGLAHRLAGGGRGRAGREEARVSAQQGESKKQMRPAQQQREGRAGRE